MKVRQTVPRQTAVRPIAHDALEEIKVLVDDIDECDDQLQCLKDVLQIEKKRERLKTLLKQTIPLDENKEHFVLVDARLAARVFYRTGRTNIDIPTLEKLIPVSIFEKVARKSQTQIVLEIGTPDEFARRREIQR